MQGGVCQARPSPGRAYAVAENVDGHREVLRVAAYGLCGLRAALAPHDEEPESAGRRTCPGRALVQARAQGAHH